MGKGHAVETVQEKIAKETKKKDVMEVLDGVDAIEKTTTLDLWIGCPAYSVKISGELKLYVPAWRSLKTIEWDCVMLDNDNDEAAKTNKNKENNEWKGEKVEEEKGECEETWHRDGR